MSEDRERFLGLCDSYTLESIEAAERAELEQRLAAGDQAALAALEDSKLLLARIAETVAPETPPEHVRERLMERIREKSEPSVVVFPKRRRLWASLAWAVAASLAVFAFFTREQLLDLRRETTALSERHHQLAAENETYAAEAQRYRRILAILSAPETLAISLNATQSPRIHAYWNEEAGLVLAGSAVPLPAPDRALQLWAIPDQGPPVSVGVFRPTPQGRALLLAEPSLAPSLTNLLAITDEPSGGSPQPTTTPIWAGSVG